MVQYFGATEEYAVECTRNVAFLVIFYACRFLSASVINPSFKTDSQTFSVPVLFTRF